MPALSRAQSHLRYPLTGILGGAANVRMLRALAIEAGPQPAPQLARMSGLTPQGARLILDSLARQQVVTVHGSGRSRLYSLNAAHPLASMLSGLFQEEARRWDSVMESLRQALSGLGSAVLAAWLYGSVARGEDSAASDLDIVVLVRSQAVADRVREALMPLEDAQQLRISLTALTAQELDALPEGDAWWAGVVRDARVLKGSAPDLTRRRLAAAAP